MKKYKKLLAQKAAYTCIYDMFNLCHSDEDFIKSFDYYYGRYDINNPPKDDPIFIFANHMSDSDQVGKEIDVRNLAIREGRYYE